jgi:hypothetical protein
MVTLREPKVYMALVQLQMRQLDRDVWTLVHGMGIFKKRDHKLITSTLSIYLSTYLSIYLSIYSMPMISVKVPYASKSVCVRS